jgi:hydroxymethylpyrimidine pyrophosphatase-like HAD family hydrolase
MTYKALAVDLDGTLLHSDDRVTQRSLDALKVAEASGLRVIIATARWRQLAERVAREINTKEPIIACAGAQVRRETDNHDLLDLRLPSEFADQLYSILDRRRCIASIALDEKVLIKMEGEPDPSLIPPEATVVRKLSGVDCAAPRIALIQGSDANVEVREKLKGLWETRVRFVESFSSRGKSMLTLTVREANKGAALSVACSEMGLASADVISFGDAEADIAMFKESGASVAMGQASDLVKSFATNVTLSNDEDGVAVALETLLKTGGLPQAKSK